MAPVVADTDTTAARIGPAHGAYTNPSPAPTTSPDQKPSPRSLGPNRASRVSGASTRAASDGTSSESPNASSTTTASVRTAPSGSPTPSITEASATIVTVNVVTSPRITPSGRRRPPLPVAASSAGSTGSTHGVSAVPAPATIANRTSRITAPNHG